MQLLPWCNTALFPAPFRAAFMSLAPFWLPPRLRYRSGPTIPRAFALLPFLPGFMLAVLGLFVSGIRLRALTKPYFYLALAVPGL